MTTGDELHGFDVVMINADRGIAPGSTKGAAQHLRGIAAGLQAAGHVVRLFSRRTAEGPFPAPVLPLEWLDRACHPDDKVGAAVTAPGRRHTVVYERYSLGHLGGLALARRLDVPFVLEVNAPLVDEALAHRPDTVADHDAAAESELLRRADLVLAVSSELASWARDHRGGPTHSLPNGFEPTWFSEPARPGAPDRPLVFLGHPKPWHGADRLVDLLVGLDGRGHRPELLVIGGGSGADDLQHAARRAGVGARVTITGALPPERATSLLRHGAVGLAPYRRHEPFYFCPLKVVDYLAAGLPVVSTDQGDIADLVGDAGIVVDPDDDRALVAAVAALLDEPTRRTSMGHRGRTRAVDSMTWRHVAERTEVAIRSVLAPADAA